jgi:hypothetical protein
VEPIILKQRAKYFVQILKYHDETDWEPEEIEWTIPDNKLDKVTDALIKILGPADR